MSLLDAYSFSPQFELKWYMKPENGLLGWGRLSLTEAHFREYAVRKLYINRQNHNDIQEAFEPHWYTGLDI